MTTTGQQNYVPGQQVGQVPAAPIEVITEAPASASAPPSVAGESITASIEATTTQIVATTSCDDFPDPEDYHRRHVLSYYLMSWCDCHLARLSRRPPPIPYRAVPFSTFLIFSLGLCSLSLSTLALFRYNMSSSVWAHLYLGVLLFVLLWTPERVNQKILRVVLQQEDEHFKSRQFWQSLSVRYRYQVACGLVNIPSAIIVGALIFQSIFQELPGLPLYILFATQGFIIGVGTCGMIVGSINFVQHINIRQIHLYGFDPHKSPVIDHISEIFETCLWIFGINLILLLVPLMFIPQKGLPLIIEFFTSVFGIALLAGLFLFAQMHLAALVKERKDLMLSSLQRRIETFYAESERLDKARFEDLQNLMKLHDQVVATSGWGLSTTRLSSYIRTCALPVLVALYTNRDLVSRIYSWLITQWPW